jgi:hypothetical protein
VTAIVAVPPRATMFDGCPTVSWHFVGVGPVVTDDVVAESHAATHNATIARKGTNAGEYLNDISVQAQLTRAVLLGAYRAPVICRGVVHRIRASFVKIAVRDGTFFKTLVP